MAIPKWLSDMADPTYITALSAAMPFGELKTAPPPQQPPAFSVASVNPATIAASAGDTTFTITGTGFDNTIQIDVEGDGYGTTAVTVVSATAITFSKNIAVDFSAGPLNINVRKGPTGTPQRVTVTITP